MLEETGRRLSGETTSEEPTTFGKLKDGETGYIGPWLVKTDEEGHMWVDLDIVISLQPCGAAELKIAKVGGKNVILTCDIKRLRRKKDEGGESWFRQNTTSEFIKHCNEPGVVYERVYAQNPAQRLITRLRR